MSHGGSLCLDFRRLVDLKQIKIKHSNSPYYIFQHEPTRKWRNINVPTMREKTLTSDQTIINLAWDISNRNLEVQLSDYKW